MKPYIYLLALLISVPLYAAPKCKTCAKRDKEIRSLTATVNALSHVPYKVKVFEDARVRIRYYPDGGFQYDLKPQKPTVLVITTIKPLRFRADKRKTAVKVLIGGEEVKANVNLIETRGK